MFPLAATLTHTDPRFGLIMKWRTLSDRDYDAATAAAAVKEDPLELDYRSTRQLLEQRIVDRMVNFTASISVDTFGGPMKWDTCILVRLDEDDPHNKQTVLDEICGDLQCDHDDIIWAMTSINETLRNFRMTLPVRLTEAGRVRVKEIAQKILLFYADSSSTEHDYYTSSEDEREEKFMNCVARVMIRLMQSQSPPRLHDGPVQYCYADDD